MRNAENMVITLTELCNFRCEHCYGDCDGSGLTMPLSTTLNCIRLAAKYGIQNIILTGGEPTLDMRSLITCVREARELKLYTCLLTNGSLTGKELHSLSRAGLDELHISYDKFHSPFITVARIKSVIDFALEYGILPVLVIIEANSFAKYEALFGKYIQYASLNIGHNFKPLVYSGRAKGLPQDEFMSDTLILFSQEHQYNICVFPDNKVSFCPVNDYFASYVDLSAPDWLGGVIAEYTQDPMIQLLLNHGVNGVMELATGSTGQCWASPFYECNFCLQYIKVLDGKKEGDLCISHQ